MLEIPEDTEKLNLEIVKLLNNITSNKIVSIDQTMGFSYRYQSKWNSPFAIDVYVTKINRNNKLSLLRIESSLNGTEKVFKKIFEAEFLKKSNLPEKSSLKYKYHAVSQLLNVLHPAASVYYNAKNSPIYTSSDKFGKMYKYIALDILLTGAAWWYVKSNLPGKSPAEKALYLPGPDQNPLRSKNAGIIFAALATSRLIRMAGAIEDTGTHNNLVEFFIAKNY